MSGGHFRSLQPRNGQGLHEKSASKKSPHFEKKWSKNPPSYEPSPDFWLEFVKSSKRRAKKSSRESI